MIIGVPKEIKNNENRVAVTPSGAMELTKRGHEVYIQSTAGDGSGFTDDEYIAAGASILPTIEATYEKAEMIIELKCGAGHIFHPICIEAWSMKNHS